MVRCSTVHERPGGQKRDNENQTQNFKKVNYVPIDTRLDPQHDRRKY